MWTHCVGVSLVVVDEDNDYPDLLLNRNSVMGLRIVVVRQDEAQSTISPTVAEKSPATPPMADTPVVTTPPAPVYASNLGSDDSYPANFSQSEIQSC